MLSPSTATYFRLIRRLRNGNRPMFEWSRKPRLVYLTVNSAGRILFDKDNMKNSNFLNSAPSTVLPFTEFQIIRTVVPYTMKLSKE